MKSNFHLLFIIQLLITASLAYTMETIKPHTPKFIELTAVEQPQSSIYLTNNTALVLHKNGCSIVDTNKNTEVKKICDHPNTLFSSGIELHPNKTKMAFFYHTNRSEDAKIAIYDLATGKREWSKKQGPSVTCASFNPLNNTIAVGRGISNKITIYNYKTNENTSFDTINDLTPIKLIRFHPTQSHKIYVIRKHLYCVNLAKNKYKQRSSASIYAYEFHTKESHKAKYISDKVTISISNHPEKYETTINYRENCSQSAIRQVKFHPNDTVLAVLDMRNHISYWDIATATTICKTTSLPTDEYYTSPCLSFAPDGKNLMFTQYNSGYGKCIILPVPFKVLYKNITKKECTFLYLVLKNYQLNDHKFLPEDILNLLMCALLKSYKR